MSNQINGHHRSRKEEALCALRVAAATNPSEVPNAYLKALQAGASIQEAEEASV